MSMFSLVDCKVRVSVIFSLQPTDFVENLVNIVSASCFDSIPTVNDGI